ncbi:Myb/SANT-like DNA-binding domain protein [Senna tora]|uniref:Myb/SANT-like DNA-binding domain protein n=1 Tax=Senna tora TaxID=362788 RepID=A0A834SED3_9FABA|nr:Myb/SANT-like DNA-binding domain protein [Senna tora]
MTVDPMEEEIEDLESNYDHLFEDNLITHVEANDDWTPEDENLVECLLDLAADKNWKTDNGFKPGFARQLENRLHEKLHESDLRDSPHIESRVKVLKKQYCAIVDMLGPKASGFGWNDKGKMIIVEKDIFKEWAKSHPDANGLYNMPFPHYKDLDKVYGKDRAIGEIAEDPVESVKAMEKEFQEQEIDHIDELQMRNDPFYGLDGLFSGDQSPLTPTSGQSVAQDNNGNGEGNIRKNKKRARAPDVVDQLVETVSKLGSFYEASNSNILELASCFKHEKEVADRRMIVTDKLKLVEGLTDIERMKA